MTSPSLLVGGVLVLLLICTCVEVGSLLAPMEYGPPSKVRQCAYSKTYGMLGADCGHLDLTEVPPKLNTDIQVLDLTFNRLRSLKNTSFINYPYLRILYLDDNSIVNIEAGAFDYIPDLDVLDLTMNSLHVIPEALYSLPVLRKLLLGHNLFSSVEFTDRLPSVEFLDLNNCQLRELPHLKQLPRLLHLNVSSNLIQSVSVHQVAPMCRLRELDLRGNPKLYGREDKEESFCNCSILLHWTSMRAINIYPKPSELCQKAERKFLSAPDNSTCYTNETMLFFQASNDITRSCEEIVLEYGSGPIRIKSSVVWTLSVIVVCVVLLLCFSSVYFVRRRNRHLQEQEDLDSESVSMRKRIS